MIPRRNKTNDDNVNTSSVFSPAEIYGLELTLEGIDAKEMDKLVELLSTLEKEVAENEKPQTDS